MERKGRPRFLPLQIMVPRAVSRAAAAILTVCLMICILAGSVPDTWNVTADSVYAAETYFQGETGSEAAEEQMPADGGSGREAPGADQEKQNQAPAENPDKILDKQQEDKQKEDKQQEDIQQEDKESEDKQPEDKQPEDKQPEELQKEEDSPDRQDTESPEENSLHREEDHDSDTEAGSGATLSETEQAAFPETESAPAPVVQESSGSGSEKEDFSTSAPAATVPAADPYVSESAQAASTKELTLTEEPWMTVTEFERAYNSVTGGAIPGDGYVPSRAVIVSKDSEIDYEALGIGKDVPGHRGHTTPVRIQDEKGNELVGVCVVPDDRGLQTWSALPDVKRLTDAVMIKLYYYTMLDDYGKNLASQRGFGSKSSSVAVAACHEAMSMRYAELAGISYDRPNIDSDFRSLVNAYRSGAASKSLPDLNKVHVYISGRIQNSGHWIQAYVFGFVENKQQAGVSLQKTCSDPDMRDTYNASYCLHETADGGTVNFRVYTDKACTKKPTSIQTKI